jgi:hypothetical protein
MRIHRVALGLIFALLTTLGRQAHAADSYRYQKLGADVFATSLMTAGVAAVDFNNRSALLLMLTGATAYATAAPAIHLIHENHAAALASLGLRFGLPCLALATVADNLDFRALLVLPASMLLAMTIDHLFLPSESTSGREAHFSIVRGAW